MLLSWDLYEIRCENEIIHGVKLRGRLRKFTIENNITCIIENAQDEDNIVRFGLLAESDPKLIIEFIKDILPKAIITDSLKKVTNPVLSKLKVNDLSRY